MGLGDEWRPFGNKEENSMRWVLSLKGKNTQIIKQSDKEP